MSFPESDADREAFIEALGESVKYFPERGFASDLRAIVDEPYSPGMIEDVEVEGNDLVMIMEAIKVPNITGGDKFEVRGSLYKVFRKPTDKNGFYKIYLRKI